MWICNRRKGKRNRSTPICLLKTKRHTVTSFFLSFQLPPALPLILGCHPASRHIHLITQCPGSSYERAVLWPAVDLLPGAAATCPVAQWFALISPRLKPSGQSSVLQTCVPISKYSLVLPARRAALRLRSGAVAQRWTCRQMRRDIQQSHMRMCFHTQSEERWSQRQQVILTPNCSDCHGA